MSWLWIIALSMLFVVIATSILAQHSTLRLENLERAAHWQSRFSSAADQLFQQETPARLLEAMAFWSDLVSDQKGAVKLAASLWHTQKAKNTDLSDWRVRSIGNPELIASFLDYAIAAIMLISYRHVLFGWFIRAQLSDMLAAHEPAQIIQFSASSAERITKRPVAYGV
jgi:hypothetical protein